MVYPIAIPIMNKHEAKGWARQRLANWRTVRFSALVRVLVFAVAVVVAGLGYAQYAQAAQTSDAYCAQYTGDSQTACKDGIRGADCNDYATIFSGQSDVNSIVAACKSGASAQQSGQISGTGNSPSPSGSGSSSASNQAAYKNAVLLACSQYSDTQQKLSCLYGGLGQNGDASSPVSISDCTNSSIVKQSGNLAQNRAACNTGSAAGQTYLSLQNNKDSTASNPNSILDQLDQANSLSQYLDVLHATGMNSGTDLSGKADNNYASYTDGAGNQQPIKVMPCTNAGDNGNCPAVIWLDGGGWHSDDGTAYCFATGSSQKNCQAGSNGGGDTGAGDKGAPAGGGANARGYTVIQVSYRLGSSGIYYMFEDVMRGIQHVVNNAGMYHIDASKIALGGDSAGGSLSMRAIASGKSGVKVGIGWSAPTNGYTGLFKSYKSLLIGMDHSTCIPTDLAGLTNTTDLLTGGSGDVAQYGQGISSNDFSFGGGSTGGGAGVSGGEGITNGLGSIGNNLGTTGAGGLSSLASGGSDLSGLTSSLSSGAGGGTLGTISQVLSAAQYAQESGKNIETISKQLEAAYNNGNPTVDSVMGSGLPSGVFNLSAKKLIECIDNFNVMSPALFASPDSPPAFLAGFDSDDVVDPQQLYDMRDKLQSLGVESDALVIPGDADAGNQALGASDNHLGYDPRFVCATLNFVDHITDPKKDADQIDCATGKRPSDIAKEQAAAANSGGGDNSGSGQSNNSGPSGPDCSMYASDGNQDLSKQKAACEAGTAIPSVAQTDCQNKGGTYTTSNGPHGGGYCQMPSAHNCLNSSDTLEQNSDGGWQCVYNKPTSNGYTGGNTCTGGSRTLPDGSCAYGAGTVNPNNIPQYGGVPCYSCGTFTGKSK